MNKTCNIVPMLNRRHCTTCMHSWNEAELGPCEKPTTLEKPTNPLDVQIGGDHYKKLKIQPAEYIHKNGIGFMEGSVIKYVSRWKGKNGVQDLEKAKHFIELLIAMERKA